MGEMMNNERLFATIPKRSNGRITYNMYLITMVISICLIFWYRATNIPLVGQQEKWLWIGLFAAEFWFCLYWIITESVRWNPVIRCTFIDKLAKRNEDELPGVDIFVCTADPQAEPPSLVISTVLSLMAYDYPPNKLNVYLSDDAGSEFTFYALWEAAQFAKYWLPFCRKNKLEPRSPAAYFSKYSEPRGTCNTTEWFSVQNLYNEMKNRVDSAVKLGRIDEDVKSQKGFSEWNSGMTERNHQAIVQILSDGRRKSALDNDGTALPTLVYMAREKRPQHHHNFKAGAMNALIRISSEISNSPLILNVDCDMYSNNSEAIKNALCFFLDEQNGQDIGFVQYPQSFDNIMKNDIYGHGCKMVDEVVLPGFDYWGGPLYIGTGCFHRREILCGRKYSKNYTEDWSRGTTRKDNESVSILEERAKSLVACTYEYNTLWGKEIGLKYGCPAEDVITGLIIQSRGWKSVYCNPPRKSFLGVAPTTLEQTLVQHKRWGEGNLLIFISNYCPFLFGHGKIKLGHQMSYCVSGLWTINSFPTLYYITIPSLCLLKGISVFPKLSSLWFIPFAYVTIAKNVYSLIESLSYNETVTKWWIYQRIWLLKNITSYLFATMDTIFNLLGISKMAFVITSKVSDSDASKRYEADIMEFGSTSPMFIIIATSALLNFFCLTFGLQMSVSDGGLDQCFIQILLCGSVVALNLPVYEAMFLRKDKGSLPRSVTLISTALSAAACILAII